MNDVTIRQAPNALEEVGYRGLASSCLLPGLPSQRTPVLDLGPGRQHLDDPREAAGQREDADLSMEAEQTSLRGK
jgi:hypothetical protein